MTSIGPGTSYQHQVEAIYHRDPKNILESVVCESFGVFYSGKDYDSEAFEWSAEGIMS